MTGRINHWWTTRPKRKLITIVDVLRVFLTVAQGKVWKGNRSLHLEFEKALEDAGLKGVGARRDQGGGGGRTYAAWLFSFGLWFAEDSTGVVRSTLAGEDLLNGVDPVPILTNQILNFQYPSPFSRTTKVDRRFRVFPFRLILEALLDSRLNGVLSEKELSAFFLTRGERQSDLQDIVQEVLKYRASGRIDSIFDQKFEAKFGNISKIKDTANTFANQLEFTQLVDRTDESQILIPQGRTNEVKRLLSSASSWISRNDEYELFQRKYGTGPHHRRDNRNFTLSPNVSAVDAERSKVLNIYWGILAFEPLKTIDKKLIERISIASGIRETKVEEIISVIGVTPSLSAFENKYLQLSMGGTSTAKDFEKATEGVFGSSGLGFETKWIGSSPNQPDIVTISIDSEDEFVGILDAKSYKAYTITGDHRRRMSFSYIPQYKAYAYEGKNLSLAFFSYIAGGLGSTINNGIKKIVAETGVSGSAITALELLKILKQHQSNPLSKTELKRLFGVNRQILQSDFEP